MGGIAGLCTGCCSLLFQNDGYPERSFADTVYQILQDRKGFMWFGTKDGLNRYDGLSFRVYKKENSSLGRNFITALYEDRRGNIWIGTDGGVFIYDPCWIPLPLSMRPVITAVSSGISSP